MILRSFYLDCLSHASYLIADPESGTAAVIDPQRDVGIYLQEARQLGVQIRHVLLTHFHADFVAGHLELRDQLGATIYLGARAKAEFDFEPMADGDRLEFGAVRLTALETPGHTPEGLSLLLSDLRKDEEPEAVFTGDTLFVGDVGRPDLMASIGITARELAEQLYDSLHGKLMTLPDHVVVWPAHGAGSMCGKNLGTEKSTTIGAQRAKNPALQPMSKESFVQLVTEGQPPAPSYFLHDAMMNRQEHATLGRNLEQVLRPLSLDELRARQAEGAQVVDVRDAEEFTAAHLEGSLNLGLGGRFASWAGTLLDREQPIVLIAPSGEEEEAAMRLGRIGLDGVAGFLDGGAEAFDEATRHDAERLDPAALRQRLESGDAPLVLDVRTPAEWGAGHIQGSQLLPLNDLPQRVAEVPEGRKVCVICRSGYRSSAAASILRHAGRTGVTDLRGGMLAWGEAGCETVGDAPSCSAS